MPLHVWKLGGSLFDLPDLAQRLRLLHRSAEGEGPVVVIPGGGPFADAVRRLEPIHGLGPHDSHEIALDTMRVSARFVAAILGQRPVVSPDRQDEKQAGWAEDGRASALDVWDVVPAWHRDLPRLAAKLGEIPSDWTLSSDSIAAILAAFWNAERLVLLKSVDVPPDTGPKDWAAMGHVDVAFPRFARHVPQVGWVNLRSISHAGSA